MPDPAEVAPVAPVPAAASVAELRRSMRAALTTAMKAKDTAAVKALRSTLGALDNAEAIPTAGTDLDRRATSETIAGATVGLGAGEADRRELTVDDVGRIVRAEIAERHEAAAQYASTGHAERAAALRAEAEVLAAYVDPPA